MSKHDELIERLRMEPTASQFLNLSDLFAAMTQERNEAADALEAQAREIEGLRKDAYRAEQLEQLARYMFEADNDYGAGFSGDPNWRLWYTRLADLVGVKLESTP